MKRVKVFGIGFHKTGTTTLDEALKLLGYKVLGVRTDLADKLIENKVNEVIDIVNDYDAVQHNPWPLVYKELDEKYPGSKFILTIRKPEEWYGSVLNHFYKDVTKMRQWIYGVGSPYDSKAIYLHRYNSHNRGVIDYFRERPGDLLVVDWSEEAGWSLLCNFLEEEIPHTSFPHANKGKFRRQKDRVFKLFIAFKYFFNFNGIEKYKSK